VAPGFFRRGGWGWTKGGGGKASAANRKCYSLDGAWERRKIRELKTQKMRTNNRQEEWGGGETLRAVCQTRQEKRCMRCLLKLTTLPEGWGRDRNQRKKICKKEEVLKGRKLRSKKHGGGEKERGGQNQEVRVGWLVHF